jgi:hypothetical protein
MLSLSITRMAMTHLVPQMVPSVKCPPMVPPTTKAAETPLAGERQIPEVVLPENTFGVDVRIVEEVQRSVLRGSC